MREEFEDILRFWFDRGVDGIRIDSAALCVKDPALPDFDQDAAVPHPYVDRDGIHEIYRALAADRRPYAAPRALIGEVWLADTERFAQYLRPDEMHTAFNFDFLGCAVGRRRRCATASTRTLAAHAPVGAPATWVLSNHDVTRHVTRYGRADTAFELALRQRPARQRPPTWRSAPAGPGRRRCSPWPCPARSTSTRARSWVCREVEDIPDDAAPGPDVRPHRRRRPGPGRLPGAAALVARRPLGFSPTGRARWLPQPATGPR